MSTPNEIAVAARLAADILRDYPSWMNPRGGRATLPAWSGQPEHVQIAVDRWRETHNGTPEERSAADALATEFRRWADALARPPIPLRIRVGVTADGKWIARGTNIEGAAIEEPTEHALRTLSYGPVVAWHWITAEVPMPETEHRETRGEVEHG